MLWQGSGTSQNQQQLFLKVGILGTLQIELVPTAILRNLTPQLQKIPASISELFMSKPNNSFYSQRDSFYSQREKPMKIR